MVLGSPEAKISRGRGRNRNRAASFCDLLADTMITTKLSFSTPSIAVDLKSLYILVTPQGWDERGPFLRPQSRPCGCFVEVIRTFGKLGALDPDYCIHSSIPKPSWVGCGRGISSISRMIYQDHLIQDVWRRDQDAGDHNLTSTLILRFMILGVSRHCISPRAAALCPAFHYFCWESTKQKYANLQLL